MKDYLIDHLDEDKRLNFQNTIDVYNLDRELDFFNFNKKDHVLDAGCGNGNVLEKLNMKGISNIHGIDLSDDRVRQAKERFKSEKNINIMMRPLEQTGFAEASYDKVLCRYIFEHVLCPKNVLTELHRILKPGGSLYIINFDDIFFNFHTKNDAFNKQLDVFQNKIPQDLKIGRKIPQLLKNNNFKNIEWHAETYFFKGERLNLERENSCMRLEQGRKNLSKFFDTLEEYDAFAKTYLEEMHDDCNVLSMTKYLIKATR